MQESLHLGFVLFRFASSGQAICVNNTNTSGSFSSTGIRWLITQKAFEYFICKSSQNVYVIFHNWKTSWNYFRACAKQALVRWGKSQCDTLKCQSSPALNLLPGKGWEQERLTLQATRAVKPRETRNESLPFVAGSFHLREARVAFIREATRRLIMVCNSIVVILFILVLHHAPPI